MAMVVLVRHASTYSNSSGQLLGWLDEGLSLEGEVEARLLGEALARELTIKSLSGVVVSSDLLRARSTAHIVARRLSCHVRLMHALRERDFGEWSGCRLSDLSEEQPILANRFILDPLSVDPLNSEATHIFRERIGAAWVDLATLAEEHDYVVAVTHDGAIRVLLNDLGFGSCIAVPLYGIKAGARFRLNKDSSSRRWQLQAYELGL